MLKYALISESRLGKHLLSDVVPALHDAQIALIGKIEGINQNHYVLVCDRDGLPNPHSSIECIDSTGMLGVGQMTFHVDSIHDNKSTNIHNDVSYWVFEVNQWRTC